MPKTGLSDAIKSVLLISDKPVTVYEVFELMPSLKVPVYPAQVRNQLKKMYKRGKVQRVMVNEKHGRHFVRYRYFLI
ncbi:hypothetical protein GCM10009007_03170 [Formosimonas limnophila]|uniref:Uncharacterized protein n=1 Tax=Formosimonas limnophila TaxID=1384487 RepID=A0A8J3FYI0_9BURK|nr:hypothetical protein GCM10009007_03170 [Formosimonas limnophila]